MNWLDYRGQFMTNIRPSYTVQRPFPTRYKVSIYVRKRGKSEDILSNTKTLFKLVFSKLGYPLEEIFRDEIGFLLSTKKAVVSFDDISKIEMIFNAAAQHMTYGSRIRIQEE